MGSWVQVIYHKPKMWLFSWTKNVCSDKYTVDYKQLISGIQIESNTVCITFFICNNIHIFRTSFWDVISEKKHTQTHTAMVIKPG